MKTNQYDCRFVDNYNDSVFHIQQFGKTTTELKKYWNSYFKNGRFADRFSFIDAYLVEKEKDIPNRIIEKSRNCFDGNKMFGVE